MKDKIVRAIAIGVVSIISAALVAYLKNPENRMELKVRAKLLKSKFQKSARKAKNEVNMRLERYSK